MTHLFLFNPYSLIFYNSLQAYFMLSLHSENAWFAALDFGGYNMAIATLMAFIGSSLGMSLNYAFGFYISRWRDELPAYNENTYQRVAGLFRRKLFFLMAIPPLFILEVMPGLSLFVLVNGMFRVPPYKALSAIMIARILYYGYHLINS